MFQIKVVQKINTHTFHVRNLVLIVVPFMR